MKCPYCGAEMEKGSLTGMEEVNWMPGNRKEPELRDFLTWEGIKTLCAPRESLLLHNGEKWDPMASWASARHCPSCHLFPFRGKVMDDEEEYLTQTHY